MLTHFEGTSTEKMTIKQRKILQSVGKTTNNSQDMLSSNRKGKCDPAGGGGDASCTALKPKLSHKNIDRRQSKLCNIMTLKTCAITIVVSVTQKQLIF